MATTGLTKFYETFNESSKKNENFSNLKTQTFSTANRLITCSIVKRKISIGSIDKELSIAVNMNDEFSLLGVDFFKGEN